MLSKKEPVKLAIFGTENNRRVKRMEEILAYTYKGLAFHKTYGDAPREGNWSITHIESGMCIFTFHNFKIIKEFTVELADKFDFHISEEELKSKIGVILRYMENNFKYLRY